MERGIYSHSFQVYLFLAHQLKIHQGPASHLAISIFPRALIIDLSGNRFLLKPAPQTLFSLKGHQRRRRERRVSTALAVWVVMER
jgi:hypothetical protein